MQCLKTGNILNFEPWTGPFWVGNPFFGSLTARALDVCL